jgi:hypothetical protein
MPSLLGKAGFETEQRPDWDDIARGSGFRWLQATTFADDVHDFGARVAAIIAPYGGRIWVAGQDWVCAHYNENLELPIDVQ